MSRYLLLAVALIALSTAHAHAVDTLDVKATVKESWTTFSGPDLPSDGHALYTARDGSIWWGVEGGAIRYNGTDWTRYSSADGLMDGAVRCITQSEDGTLWFAGSHRGRAAVAGYDGEAWRVYSEKDGLVGAWISSLAFDTAGNLWANSLTAFSREVDPVQHGYGVMRYDGNTWRNYRMADGLVHNRVHRIAAGSDGAVWFATHGGVSCFDGEKWATSLVWRPGNSSTYPAKQHRLPECPPKRPRREGGCIEGPV
jgi:ligand-binding sensor domain-containing protein